MCSRHLYSKLIAPQTLKYCYYLGVFGAFFFMHIEIAKNKLTRDLIVNSFKNPIEISISDILNSQSNSLRDYSNGGIYLINTEYGVYIGKSIDYKYRLIVHLRKCTNKTTIDRVLNNCNTKSFFLLLSYKDAHINFFTRKYETIVEQTFIQIAKTYNYNILNDRIYGHLQIV